MQHFPIYLNMTNRDVLLAGSGEIALAKLRLLARTPARLTLFAPDPEPALAGFAAEVGAVLLPRKIEADDLHRATLVYAATGDPTQDARIARLAHKSGVLLNIVDNLEGSDFITPAIVDRAPVTVAIGTEGAAPVLARAIKSELEERLPETLGTLAHAGKRAREAVEALPLGRARRDFWVDYYFRAGPEALDVAGETSLGRALHSLLADHLSRGPSKGRVDLVGAGPGAADLMTLRARKLLDQADVVIHDGLVPQPILELARREALFIAVGKQGFGPSTPQHQINELMIEHARAGARVVRLKGGDPTIFGRLDEETEALSAAQVDWAVTPGITAASAAAASIGTSMTRRGRNQALQLLTAQDVDGLAEQDWKNLSLPGTVAAVSMGKRAARFLQGRLLMHGADPATPVTVVANASRPDQRILPLTLETLATDLAEAALQGPAILLLGLAPAAAAAELPQLLAELG